MMKNNVFRNSMMGLLVPASFALAVENSAPGGTAEAPPEPKVTEKRAAQVRALRFGMMIHWGIPAIFGGGDNWYEPARSKALEANPANFKPTGFDARQWVATAKAAGMSYLLPVTKHHDGMCLWDTKTTQYTTLNSPLRKDVLAELRKACDEQGIKLAFYFSDKDWSIVKPQKKGEPKIDQSAELARNAEVNRRQLEELCTKYGPIEFFWIDMAAGGGGLSQDEVTRLIKGWQPDCLVGFNHGEGGDMRIGESYHYFSPKRDEKYGPFAVREFAKQIVGDQPGGGNWFYPGTTPPMSAERVLWFHEQAEKDDVLFSLDVGPGPDGKLREVDVAVLKEVGRLLKEKSVQSGK